jgi:hypothetical protein
MDPVTISGCVALATGSFKALKGAISAGKDLADCANQLNQWGKACSDFSMLQQREENPPFWKKTFRGSDEESAILLWNNERKFKEMRESLKNEISFVYGPSAWKEVLAIEAQQRKRRKDELYRKQEQVDAAINFAIGAFIFAISGGILFILFYFLGKYQGRW